MPCIIDGNKILLTPIKDMLIALQQNLILTGSKKLRDIEFKQQNAVVSCPNHKGGCENRPSCNVLLYDKNTNGYNSRDVINAGTAYCFTCGYRASFVKFVSDCLGSSYRKATDWLLSYSDYDLYVEPRKVEIDIFGNETKRDNYDTLPPITSDDLMEYDYIHEYMFKRKLTPDIIEKYEVGYSPKEKCLTFPVYLDGRCLFIAKRSVCSKRFYMPVVNPKPIYGIDYISSSCNELYITESVINALTLCSYGLSAVALFGTGSDYQIEQLNKLQVRKLVLCLDGDEAGIRGRKRIMDRVKNKLITYIELPNGKDVNDLTKNEFYSLKEKF